MSESLESLILGAKLKMSEDDNTMIIDRNHYASRKRNRVGVCTVTNADHIIHYNSATAAATSNDNIEANFWQEKYDSLVCDRIDAEKDMDHHISTVNDIILRKDNYIKLLEKKIERLSSSNTSSNTSSNENKVISFYEQITGMTVKVNDDDNNNDNNYTCTIKNKQRRIASRFMLTIDDKTKKNATSIKYTPIANITVLPEYLHSAIEFEPGMAPVLLGDVLNTIFEDV